MRRLTASFLGLIGLLWFAFGALGTWALVSGVTDPKLQSAPGNLLLGALVMGLAAWLWRSPAAAKTANR